MKHDDRLLFMKWAAREAGKIMMPYWGREGMEKPDHTRVTQADLNVSEFVHAVFPKEDPYSGILSEEQEDSPERLTKKGVYIIDELDGTQNFERGEDDFCFLCAYAEGGVLQIGVIYEPVHDRMLFAEKGGKAFIQNGADIAELPALEPKTWEESVVMHSKNYKGDKYEKLFKMMEIPEERRATSGSMGIRLARVAMQEVQMILGYTRKLKEWDIAAGHAVVEAMGVSVTDMFGNPLVYNQEVPRTHKGFLVLHPGIKQITLEKLAQCRDRIEM